jgi:hypothetical protein
MKKSILVLLLGIFCLSNYPLNAQIFGKSALKATIDGISEGLISKDILLKSGIIQCTDNQSEIIYYSLSFMRKNDLVQFYGSGNTLNESMKNEIKGLESGTKISIEEIGARTAENKIIKLPDLLLILN